MEFSLPVKRLNRLNWLLAIVVSIMVYIMMRSLDPAQKYKLVAVAESITGITLIGHIDVILMLILARRFDIRSKKFNKYRYLFSYPAGVAVYLLIWPFFAYLQHRSWSFGDIGLFLTFVGAGVIVNTLVIILHDSVLLYEHKLYSDLELSRLKTANAEATNLLLKQQIHPHFLFNALNTLKALYRKDPTAGDTYIVHLANFLRASVYNYATKVSKLEDEVALLINYLEMQKIRFGTALDCTIDLPEQVMKDHFLPSFSLQPLLENAIKHNELTQHAPLIVHIFYLEGRIIVYNNLQKKSVKASSANHGLANLAERYMLWSGDEVLIKEDINTFSVSIKLLTNEHSNHRG
jgi:sensor histidine kinase YesM